MDKVFLLILLFLSLALGIDTTGLVGLAVLALMAAGAFGSIFGGKFPHHFISKLVALTIGLLFICCLLNALFFRLKASLGSFLGSTLAALFLLALLIGSFLFIRSRLFHKENTSRHDSTNERQPILPHHDGDEQV